jgi:hypothetical protein
MTLAEKIEALEHPNDDLTLYDICRRNAGWAILWHSKEKGPDERVPHPLPQLAAKGITKATDAWRRGLFVLAYYPTFEAMVEAEHARLFPGASPGSGEHATWPACKAHGVRWPCAECEKGAPAPAIHLPHNPVPPGSGDPEVKP